MQAAEKALYSKSRRTANGYAGGESLAGADKLLGVQGRAQGPDDLWPVGYCYWYAQGFREELLEAPVLSYAAGKDEPFGHARAADVRLAKYFPGVNFDLTADG